MGPASAAAISRYRTVQATTCTPGQLLVMLYDGLFRFLRQAKAAMEKREVATAGERISRSHAILEQLLAGLDPTVAPELCEKLEALYLFCMGQLLEANLHGDPDRIERIVTLLGPLRDAWSTVVTDSVPVAGAEASTR